MVHPLYAGSDIIYAGTLIMILIYDLKYNIKKDKTDREYRHLLLWVIFFCLQDAAWGICAGPFVNSRTALMLASTVFHASTVMTTYFWLRYVVIYLGDKLIHKKWFYILDAIIISIQCILLVINFFIPAIFYIDENGIYHTASLRALVLTNQCILYLIIGIFTAYLYIVSKEQEIKNKYLAVFFFALNPIVFGILQSIFPNGPLDSIGYYLGCFIIHFFIILREKDELQQFQLNKQKMDNEIKIAEQVAINKTDRLTGMNNRHSYEDDLIFYSNHGMNEDFVYASMDINGLKGVNDNLGHAAGDELIKGASDCLKQCLGAYGKLYRIGGDEFAAMFFANADQLNHIRSDLEQTTFNWKGKTLDSLSISIGFAAKREFMDFSVTELSKIADERMYSVKNAYYMNRGIDRQGQQTAYAALCESYVKILRVNLTTEQYKVIHMDKSEENIEMGFSDKISVWLYGFSKSGQIHPDDIDEYTKQTDIDYLREYFRAGNRSIHIFYKRIIHHEYSKTMMEMIPAEDYSDDNQSFYLYVKNINE